MSNMTIWSNVAPPGRSYTDHVKAEKLPDGDPAPDKPTFTQVVTNLGIGPIRCNPSLGVLFEMCEMGYSADTGLEEDTAVINGNLLRVTGMYA